MTQTSIQQVGRAYLKEFTYRQLAYDMCKLLEPHGMSISAQTIFRWVERGAKPINKMDALMIVADSGATWDAGRFAADILAAWKPNLFQPRGEIGRRVLRAMPKPSQRQIGERK